MHFGPYLVTCAIKAPIQFYLLVATAEKGGASQRILTVIETVYGGVRLQSSVAMDPPKWHSHHTIHHTAVSRQRPCLSVEM
jgi:hypothetical protein